MTNQDIKNLLLNMYNLEFNINHHVNLYDTKTQPFSYDAYFEFKTDKWHDAQLTVDGTIIKDTEPDFEHNPLADGRNGESQGGGVFINSWSIDKIKVEVDGKEIDLITLTDLRKAQEIISNN